MTISNEFWQFYKVTEKDLEDIYNFLLETESPLDKFEISRFLIDRTIVEQEKFLLAEAAKAGDYYLPEKSYAVGDSLVFPAKGKKKGSVTSVRNGNNPDYPELQIIDVKFTSGDTLSFAANLKEHKLNNPEPEGGAEFLDSAYVFEHFGNILAERISEKCAENDDLVCIGRQYFPRALLFDIGIGHLAFRVHRQDALLDAPEDGLQTPAVIGQIRFGLFTRGNIAPDSSKSAVSATAVAGWRPGRPWRSGPGRRILGNAAGRQVRQSPAGLPEFKRPGQQRVHPGKGR